jgi:flagellar M-ring protein FliF
MTAFDFLNNYSKPARNGLLIGAALVLLGMAAAMWWLFSPSYQLLFGNLAESDAAEVTKSLSEWKIPYRFTDDGTGIEVPKDQVYDTRMKLVSAGVPSGGHVGFELFNDSDFGVTEFAQRVNYQRALQGELERSISALPGVESVRVHLTIRRPGLFVGQSDSSKASVAVTMTPGEILTPQQVGGVRNLVASAVEGLDPAAVVVLGPTGVMAGGASGGGQNTLLVQNEEQSGYEAHVRERISDLLSSVFHLQQFRVSVDARLNFDQIRKVSERLIPQGVDGNGLVVRKRTSRSGSTAPVGTAATPTPTQDQDETDFAHGTEREEISTAPGKVERLSIAVLVPPSLSTAELDRLRKLVTAAAGLDIERGDRLEIGAISDSDRKVTSPSVSPLLQPEPMAPAIVERERSVPNGGTVSLGLWLALAGVIGLAIGWLFAAARRPAPPKLRYEEREQVLLRLRSWLAEGETVV